MREFESQAVRRGFSRIAGVDEAGRGPLAGPVVSAAVVLPLAYTDPDITDSKKLTPRQRDQLHERILARAVGVGIGIVPPRDIDRLNIREATRQAMAIAVNQLNPPPDVVLIDGNTPIDISIPQETIVKGDARSISIAAASIVAKVTRDRIMVAHHQAYPQYGFDAHKGYPTRVHREAVRRYGPCPIHRLTFRGVRQSAEEDAPPPVKRC